MNVRGIQRAGGLPILIPHILDEKSLEDLYFRVDGILLPGGGDIDPSLYGQSRHEKTDFVETERDKVEIQLARWSAQDDRPLFGICRGQQIVNVALGGTLTQDIPSLVDTKLVHFPPLDVPRDHIPHEVEVTPDSVLNKITGKTTLPVNSLHHQCVDRLADELRPTAFAPDGIIEATELPDAYFYHTVQWHPEDLIDSPVMQSLFDAFVKAAGEHMG